MRTEHSVTWDMIWWILTPTPLPNPSPRGLFPYTKGTGRLLRSQALNPCLLLFKLTYQEESGVHVKEVLC